MDPKKEKRNLLVFGYGLVVILTLIGYHQWKHHGWFFIHYAFGLAMLVILYLTWFRLDMLKAFYKKWMVVAHFIGTVITGIILTIFYYVVFGVAGIITRIIGKDLLNKKIDLNAESYWIQREQKEFIKEEYTRQF